jgi:nucleoside-diphosphate-sugar epimerase
MRILITGKHSYIGSSVKAWLNEKEAAFVVDEISLRNINLNTLSFKNYDIIFHLAGIAHITSNKKMIPEYFKINRDLAIEVSKKAKEEGVKQFIFTSTMAIYGDDRPIGDFRPIDVQQPSPTNAYGQSKLQADEAIQKLQDQNFKVSILRIPMVYGVNSKGNFLKLEKLARKVSIFPKLENKRSVINVLSLSELIRLLIIKNKDGVFYPQDKEYFSTSTFINAYRKKIHKKTIFIPFLSIILKFLAVFIRPINKIYGNKFYDAKVSNIEGLSYQIESWSTYIEKL